MATNEYGLDVHYFKKNLEKILLEIECYTPEEMQTALHRLSRTASDTRVKIGMKRLEEAKQDA
ncbi:MAG: hypothetical protein JKY09_09615 [Crocinitomicaceae bacterium]|nr:hypothetical protein [Crocinitomicaceae bacterium]